MTGLAPAVEAAELTIEPRPDGGFVLGDLLGGAGVEVRRAAGGSGRAANDNHRHGPGFRHAVLCAAS